MQAHSSIDELNDCAPTVGAVITNYNGEETVIHTITSLLQSEYPLEQIVVVDNGSNDGSLEEIESCFSCIAVIKLNSNRGPCVSRNRGLQHLSTRLALLIDDDVVLESAALTKLIDAYRYRRCEILLPRIVFYPPGNIIQADGGNAHFLGTLSLNNIGSRCSDMPADDDAPEGIPVGAGISACMLVDRETILKIGAFDELYFFYFEDLEVCLRARQYGYEVRCVRQAVARHHRGSGTPGLSFRGADKYPEQRFYLSNRNRLLTILTHLRLRTLFLLIPPYLLYELVVLAFALRMGFTRKWLRSWSWQFKHRAEIRERRNRTIRFRTLSDAELLSAGDIPIAPKLIRNPVAIFSTKSLSRLLTAYWILVRRLLR